MSKPVTPPSKKTTTAASNGKRKPAEPAPKRAPAKPAAVRKPSPTSDRDLSDKSYKKPSGNPRVSRRLPEGLSKSKPAPKTHGLPEGSLASKTPRKPVGSKAAPSVTPAALPRDGFRRASLTITATLAHGEGHSTHQTGPQAHKTAASTHRQGGTLHGTQDAPHVPGDPQPAPGLAPAGTRASKPLTFIEQRYCFEYVQDGNQTRAYMRATGTTHYGTSANAAYQLMKKPEIRAQIEVERAALQARVGVTAEDMLRRLWSLATADPRELIEWHVGSCRYCHGEGHLYHRTTIEFDRDRKEFESHGRQRIDGMYLSTKKKAERTSKRRGQSDDEEVFEVQGGPGFDPKVKPHEDCPQCHGNGHGKAIIKDTRLLSPQAALLYAGIKEGKEGIEVKMHNPMDAIEKINKHIGFYDADNRQKDKTDPFTALLERISGPSAALPINPNPQDGDEP